MPGETHDERPRHCLICHNAIEDPSAECPHCRTRAAGRPLASPPVLTLAGVISAMLVLWALTTLATAYFRQTREARQHAHMIAAATSSQAGDLQGAAEEYRAALEFGRFDFGARLGLASTLVRLDRSSEAQNHLRELREADPTHALVNHLLGRIAAAAGEVEDAVSYYRTAIHGRWPAGSEDRRFQARLDLVELLVSAGEQLQAVAELSEALEEAPQNPTVRRRIGRLWLEAGAPARAAEVFEDVLRGSPDDATALLGLGEAELARGRFLSARTAFTRAAATGEAEAEVAPWLALCNEVIELDPTYRRAGTRERLRRSQELARRALAGLERCLGPEPAPGEGPPDPPEHLLVASAREQLEASVVPARAEEAVEENIALAERLWGVRTARCPGGEHGDGGGDEPLRLVIEKLAQ